MGTSIVINGLRDKCTGMAGRIAAVIRMFEPARNPELIPAIRPTGRSLFFRLRELHRLCLSALRHIEQPTRCRVIAGQVIVAQALGGLDARVRDQLTEKVRRSITSQERKGIVRQNVDWPGTWWD